VFCNRVYAVSIVSLADRDADGRRVQGTHIWLYTSAHTAHSSVPLAVHCTSLTAKDDPAYITRG
jgi:hypothetical protein